MRRSRNRHQHPARAVVPVLEQVREAMEPILAASPTPERITEQGIRPAPHRIIRITYRSGRKRRVVSTLAKIPYGGMFAMLDVLGRAVSMGDIRWFRIEAPLHITDVERDMLRRWPEALASTTAISGVTWLA